MRGKIHVPFMTKKYEAQNHEDRKTYGNLEADIHLNIDGNIYLHQRFFLPLLQKFVNNEPRLTVETILGWTSQV